ncbi:hypothetical protein [Synechococcus sp. PCC 7336]|nr:hypothetical protein [Synechococcus sp. PCC 7336]
MAKNRWEGDRRNWMFGTAPASLRTSEGEMRQTPQPLPSPMEAIDRHRKL